MRLFLLFLCATQLYLAWGYLDTRPLASLALGATALLVAWGRLKGLALTASLVVPALLLTGPHLALTEAVMMLGAFAALMHLPQR